MEQSTQAASSATTTETTAPSQEQAAPAQNEAANPNPNPSPDQAADRNTMTPQQDAASTAQQLDMANLLGEDFAKDPALKDFKDVKGLAKAYTDLKSAFGKPRFDVPAADAPQEQVNEFFKKLGVPDSPEAYGLKAPDGYPEHMGEYMTETLTEYAKVAHDLKLTPKQVAGIQGWFDKMAMGMGEAAAGVDQNAVTEANTRLNEIFTKQFGDKTAEAAVSIKGVLEKVFPDQAVRADLEKTLPNEALLALAAMDKYYKTTYGLSDQNIDDQGENTGKSLEDLRKEAQTVMASDAYRDPMHKDHKETKAKADNLYKTIGALTDAQKKR